MAQAQAPRHLDALTGIRGIAAWGVVLYHIRLSLVMICPPWLIAILGRGYLAVDLFFMLSGFVIWYNYAERIAAGGWAAARLFLWRRFTRVWPLHGAILLAFIGLVAVLAATGRDTAGYPLAELPLHVLLLQNWGFTPRLSWNHPAWSISTEMAAYLVFPALVVAMQWARVPTLALLALAGAVAVALHAGFAARGYDGLGGDITHLGLWRCLAGFVLGCLMCQLWQRWRAYRIAWLIAATACAAILGLAAMLSLAETAFVPAAFFAGLLALALAHGPLSRVLGGGALHYLGEISYSTYLVHFLLFILFKLAFVDRSLQIGWFGLAAYLAMVLTASVVLYHGLEKPAQRWLNANPPRWRRPIQRPLAD
ncbi:acyltransferase family protein [Novosphingobium aquiterrae]|uniref:Acyltransferase family protein n=1 Tax=Novosphingobium aquiterrae TaxID=624388 RepID=A0ABV6PLS3_9SPHN